MPKVQVSIPGVVLAGVLMVGILVLVGLKIVAWPAAAAFLAGSVLPVLWASSSSSTTPEVKAVKPPAGLSVLFFILALLVLLRCTPAQVQTITKTVSDVAQCINAEASKTPPETDEQIAIACGLEAAPDVIAVVGTIAAKRRGVAPCNTITVDAGPPTGVVGK